MRGSSMRTSHREANKKGMMAKGSSSLAGRAFDEFGGGDTFLTERPSTAASDDTAFAGLSARKSLAPATDGRALAERLGVLEKNLVSVGRPVGRRRCE